MSIKGSKTEQNLIDAFAAESAANRRYSYFASKADVEGHKEIAELFRATAEGETGHAHGLLEYLEECGDPVTGLPFGSTSANLKCAIASEIFDSSERYPAMAAIAREEGFTEIAAWFETLAKAEKAHTARFQQLLAALEN